MDSASEGRALGYGELLKTNRDFRLLWLGTVVSFLGDWLTTVAVITIATELSDTSLAVALTLAAKTLPIFLIVPVAGPIADRVDRRTILLASDLVRAALVVGMLAAYLAGDLTAVLVLLTLRTTAGGFFLPARSAVVPELAIGRQLPVAMALNGGTWSVMLALGAAAGGVVTQLLGVTGALVVDALTFLLSAAFIAGLPSLPPSEQPAGQPRRASLLDALGLLWGRWYLATLLGLKSTLALSGAALVALPIYAGGLFPGWVGPLFLGGLYASRGVGALIGSMGVRKLIGDAPARLRWAIVPAFAALAAGYLLMAVAGSYPVAAAGLLVAMIGSGVVWTFSGTLAQLATHREVRGRLFSMEFGASMLISAAASLAGGAALDAGVPPRTLVAGLAAAHLLPALGWAAVLLLASDIGRTTSGAREDAPDPA